MPTLEENVNRVKAAKTAIGNAITAKGGTVGANDGLEDFAADIATIPSGGGVEFSNDPLNFSLIRNIRNLNVDVPSGVTSLTSTSFENCHGLKSINLPETVQSIDGNAFKNCTNLANISMQNGITSLGDSVFAGCSSITSIELPSTLTTIGSHTFQSCNKLTSIEIPSSVTSIGGYAFNNCVNLRKIYVNKPENSISGSPWNAPTSTEVIWRANRYTTAVNEVSSGTSLTTSVSCTVGDLIIATFENLGGEYTLPSGWTLLGDSGAVVTSQWTQRTGMAYKIAEATTESFTLTQASSGRMFTNLIAITGASIGIFSGFTKNETNNTITATKPQGLTIWAVSTLWWGSKWEVTPIDDKTKISNNRCENFLDQSDDTTVTFTTDTTQPAGGLACASLTITGIDNFWYYDEPT